LECETEGLRAGADDLFEMVTERRGRTESDLRDLHGDPVDGVGDRLQQLLRLADPRGAAGAGQSRRSVRGSGG
jgi:hypothetical protein